VEIKKSKIMVGNKVLKDHGILQLEQLNGNSFSYELPLKAIHSPLSEEEHLAGKNIFMWITADDGQKSFLSGTVGHIRQTQYSSGEREIILSGEIKKQIYALSLLTSYRLTLTLSLLIPAVFLTALAYLIVDQKQHLIKQTGTVTAFSKHSSGARSLAIYKFKLQEFKANFERPYEGLSRFTAKNLRDEIYDEPSQSFPYSIKKQLKPADQRRYSWYIESADQARLNTAGVTLPYVYLHTANTQSDALFIYDLYTYVFDKYHMFIYLFASFMLTIPFLLMGVSIKNGNKLFWKIYGGIVMITFLLLFII